jgi:hypothetical protein
VASLETFEGEAAAVVGAGAMTAEIAAVTETSETDEMNHRHSETTAAGSGSGTGGTAKEIASEDAGLLQAPGGRHPAEISATATFR